MHSLACSNLRPNTGVLVGAEELTTVSRRVTHYCADIRGNISRNYKTNASEILEIPEIIHR